MNTPLKIRWKELFGVEAERCETPLATIDGGWAQVIRYFKLQVKGDDGKWTDVEIDYDSDEPAADPEPAKQ